MQPLLQVFSDYGKIFGMKNMKFLTEIPVAHRGLHDDRLPENSLGAFLAAANKGYAIETDVRLTKDGALVLFHDDNLSRMAGIEKKVSECTAEQLSRVRLGGTDERIPLLSELLSAVCGRVPLLIEIKDMPKVKTKDFIKKVSDALEGYRGEYAVQSFQPFYVKAFKKLRPEVPCGVLATAVSNKGDFGNSPFWKIKARMVKNMSFNRTVKPDFISYYFASYPQKSTEKFKGAKLAWTVRSPEEEARARQYADNIIFENFLPEITK